MTLNSQGLFRFFRGDPATTGPVGRGKHGIQEARKKIVQLLAPERVDADDSLRFHPDETSIAQHFEMAGGSRFTKSQGNLATVQTISLGNGPDDFQAGRVAQGEKDRRKGNLIFGRMKRLSHRRG
jgi:hypothetical protein